MDAELKRKWVDALRSGEYKQTRGTLKDEHGYCCLGVLCEVAGLPIRKNGSGVEGYGVGPNSFSAYEPIFALVGGFENSHPLSMRNDGCENPDHLLEPHSFAEIADYIEKAL